MLKLRLPMPRSVCISLACRAFSATLGLSAVLLCGCDSPTLPLPPPLAPSISAGSDADHVTLTATCNVSEKDALIVVVNEGGVAPVPPDKAVGGAFANACGAWQTEVYAHTGDSLVVTYQLGEEESLPTVVTVRQ